jgi:hypothetical protein
MSPTKGLIWLLSPLCLSSFFCATYGGRIGRVAECPCNSPGGIAEALEALAEQLLRKL